MPSIQLSDAEQSALHGLPYLQIVLYVLAIRPRMDFTTGLVGMKPRISWQALSESVYIEPHQGIKGGSPDKSAIRRAAEGLERAGLVRIASRDKQLIFKCLLANQGKSAPNKDDTNPTYQADTAKPARVKALRPVGDIPEKAKADIHPVSVISTYIPPPPEISPVVEAAAVEFAHIIKPDQRQAVLDYLKKAPAEKRQDMADELAAYMNRKSAQGEPVRSPAGVMRRMVERERSGELVIEQAHVGRAMRENEKRFAAKPAVSGPAQRTQRPQWVDLMAALGKKPAQEAAG